MYFFLLSLQLYYTSSIFDKFVCKCEQVLGADILQTKDPYKSFELLKLHIEKIRSHNYLFSESKVEIIVERNLGFEAEHVYRECRSSIPNCEFMVEPGVDRIGVLTTHTRKLAYVSVMNIMLKENRIYCSKDSWVECGENNSRTVLLDQMSFFGFMFTRPDNAFQKEKVAINGKSAGGKDDLCMSLLIGMFFVHEGRYEMK